MRAGPVRFADVYAAAQRDPEGVLGRGRGSDRLDRPWDRVLDRSRPPFYRWFVGAELNTCYNASIATSSAAAATQRGADLRQPRHRHGRALHLSRAARRSRALRRRAPRWASARATASSSTCRWCRRRCSRCSRARASARFTPWSSAASPRRARHAHRRRAAESRCSPRPAASRSAGVVAVQAAARQGASRSPRTSRDAA